MNEGKKYDRLEDFFRRNLKESSAPKDWNTPSDGVFLNAMELIDEPSSSSHKPWWLIGLLVFGLLGGVLFWSNYKMNSLQQKIVELEKKYEHNQTPLKEDMLDSNSIEKEVKENIEPVNQSENNQKNVKQTISTLAETKLKSNNPVLEKENNIGVVSKYNFVPSGENLSQDQSKIQEKKENSYQNNNEVNSSKIDISLLNNAISLVRSNDNLEFSIDIPFAINNQSNDSARRLGLYLFFGTNFSSFDMSLSDPNEVLSMSLVNYDNYKSGYNLGLGGYQDISNKWSLNYTLGYTKIRNASLYQNAMTFDKSNESIDAFGEYWYDSNMALESPISSVVLRQSLSMNDGTAMDGEQMMMKSDINQGFDIVDLSLGLRYSILRRGPIDIGLGLNAHLGYIYGSNENFDINVLRNDQIFMKSNLVNNSVDKLNQWILGYSPSFDLQYSWNDTYFTGLNLGYYNSLSSLRSKSDQFTQTHLSSLNLNISAGLKF